jgi:hypothetical protein
LLRVVDALTRSQTGEVSSLTKSANVARASFIAPRARAEFASPVEEIGSSTCPLACGESLRRRCAMLLDRARAELDD